jgi:hypothetical protein
MKKIEFFSTIDGMTDLSPIIEAKDYRPAWVAKCREDYVDFKERTEGLRGVHAYRCPAMFEIMQEGFLLTAPWDIIIETEPGKMWDFKWTVPDAELANLMDVPLVVSHKEAAQHIPVPKGALNTIVKIATPWHVVVPDNLKLLVLPLSYDDNVEYYSVPGLFDPGHSSEINVQLRWFNNNGRITIKTGTPLAHVIPLSEHKFELVVRDANERDKLWLKKRKLFHNYSFAPIRNKIKELYIKHWKK